MPLKDVCNMLLILLLLISYVVLSFVKISIKMTNLDVFFLFLCGVVLFEFTCYLILKLYKGIY